MPIRIFNTFDDPLALTGTTEAFGVNDTDQIVGQYDDATGRHGFLVSNGIFTTLGPTKAEYDATVDDAGVNSRLGPISLGALLSASSRTPLKASSHRTYRCKD